MSPFNGTQAILNGLCYMVKYNGAVNFPVKDSPSNCGGVTPVFVGQSHNALSTKVDLRTIK